MDEKVLVSNCYAVKIQKPGVGFLTDSSGEEIYLSPKEVENMIDAFDEDVALFDIVCGLKILLVHYLIEEMSGLDGHA